MGTAIIRDGIGDAAETTITVNLLKGKKLPAPRIESPTEIMTIATGCPWSARSHKRWPGSSFGSKKITDGTLAGLRYSHARREDFGWLLRHRTVGVKIAKEYATSPS